MGIEKVNLTSHIVAPKYDDSHLEKSPARDPLSKRYSTLADTIFLDTF
jgi:hypothetical protein